jgi:hypothetical protein
MIKISRKDIENMMSQFHFPISEIEDMQAIDVYHIHNWDHTIKHWDEDLERNDNPPLREFYFDLKDMLNLLIDYLNIVPFEKAIVSSLNGGRFIGIPYTKDYEHCVNEMTKWLHLNSMRINSSAGLLVSKQELMSCIDMISECGFMGMSELYIFIPEARIAIYTHHQMNYVIYTDALDKQKLIIEKIVDLHNNIAIYIAK